MSAAGSPGWRPRSALQTFGIKAEVFEAAPALGEIGAAVNVSPQANKALQAIGVGDKVAAVGTASPGIYTRNMQTGEFLEFNDRLKSAARYGAPYYTFHRADLLNALASGLDRGAHSSRTPPDGNRGAKRLHHAHFRQWRGRRG